MWSDVTLPSCLNESLGSRDTAAAEASGGQRRRACRRLLDCSPPSSFMLGTIYQEMMTVYEQLKVRHLMDSEPFIC